MNLKPKLIGAEESPWYYPNCGREADGEMKNGERRISCRKCEVVFLVEVRGYSNFDTYKGIIYAKV